MPATVVHSASVVHSAIQKGLMDGSTIGFIASALVLAALGMRDMGNLRIVALCSNVAFITYALLLNLPPILILHIILLPLNGWRLAQELQIRMRKQLGKHEDGQGNGRRNPVTGRRDAGAQWCDYSCPASNCPNRF